ncbi:unnamed protein product [Musa acuminata subsp. burmannicoides]
MKTCTNVASATWHVMNHGFATRHQFLASSIEGKENILQMMTSFGNLFDWYDIGVSGSRSTRTAQYQLKKLPKDKSDQHQTVWSDTGPSSNQ